MREPPTVTKPTTFRLEFGCFVSSIISHVIIRIRLRKLKKLLVFEHDSNLRLAKHLNAPNYEPKLWPSDCQFGCLLGETRETCECSDVSNLSVSNTSSDDVSLRYWRLVGAMPLHDGINRRCSFGCFHSYIRLFSSEAITRSSKNGISSLETFKLTSQQMSVTDQTNEN